MFEGLAGKSGLSELVVFTLRSNGYKSQTLFLNLETDIEQPRPTKDGFIARNARYRRVGEKRRVGGAVKFSRFSHHR